MVETTSGPSSAAGQSSGLGSPSDQSSPPSMLHAFAQLDISERKVLLLAGDAIALALALSLGLLALRDVASQSGFQPLWYALLVAVWLAVSPVANLYDLRLASKPSSGALGVLPPALAVVAIYLAIPYLTPPLLSSRLAALTFCLSAITLVAVWRYAYASLVWQPRFQSRVLVVGAGWAGRTVTEAIHEHASRAYRLVGFVDSDPAKQHTRVAGVPVLGDESVLRRLVGEQRVDEVVLAITGDFRADLHAALLDAFERGVRVTPMADLYESLTSRIPVEHVGQRWFAVIPTGAAGDFFHSLFHRALDLAIALPGTVALGLLLPFVALAIKLDSQGPVFYSQERVGQRGKVFWITKFRSMRADAEVLGQAIWAKQGDSRITRVGRVLRKTRIDELPQFVSILRGDMSLIGPRPERPTFVDLLERKIPFYRARHFVKPGLTGWAQVMYHYGSSVEDALVKLQYDLYYIKHDSVLLDLLIVLKTIGIVLRWRGT